MRSDNEQEYLREIFTQSFVLSNLIEKYEKYLDSGEDPVFGDDSIKLIKEDFKQAKLKLCEFKLWVSKALDHS